MAHERITTSTLLLALVLAVAGSTLGSPTSSRIFEGEDATSGQFSYVASVRVDNAHVGSASILNNVYLLTAAHIVNKIDPSRISVRVGSTNQLAGGSVFKVAQYIQHPSFGNFLHDICLLKLATPLTLSSTVSTIALPEPNEEVAEGTVLTVAGWGLLSTGASPYRLQHSNRFRAINAGDCEYSAGFGYESALCMDRPVGWGICRGDAGSGVVANNKLVGSASFAFGDCGTKYPDVAVLVSYYVDWIIANMA